MNPLHRDTILAIAECGLNVPEIENYRWWVVPYKDSEYNAYIITLTTLYVDRDPANRWKPEWDEERQAIVVDRKKEEILVEASLSATFRGHPFHMGFVQKERVGVLWMDKVD